jgi:hypothetical protein
MITKKRLMRPYYKLGRVHEKKNSFRIRYSVVHDTYSGKGHLRIDLLP